MTKKHMTPHILIVEDEPPQAELLKYNLEKEGFKTSVAEDGEAALRIVDEDDPDLVVLDWMLPHLSGIEVCQRLRGQKKTKTLPVIMVTARGEEGDRVRGLEVGADDYMVKPYSPKEMVARVQAVLRRSGVVQATDRLEYENVTLDMTTHKVTRDGKPIHLGPTEFRLLQVLLERPAQVFSRDLLLDRVWGRDIYVEDRTVDVHIGRLRKALNTHGGDNLIRTIRGVGYSIDSESY